MWPCDPPNPAQSTTQPIRSSQQEPVVITIYQYQLPSQLRRLIGAYRKPSRCRAPERQRYPVECIFSPLVEPALLTPWIRYRGTSARNPAASRSNRESLSAPQPYAASHTQTQTNSACSPLPR